MQSARKLLPAAGLMSDGAGIRGGVQYGPAPQQLLQIEGASYFNPIAVTGASFSFLLHPLTPALRPWTLGSVQRTAGPPTPGP
jgi:hypothetical protein